MQPGDRRTLEVEYRAEIPCGGYRLSWFPVGGAGRRPGVLPWAVLPCAVGLRPGGSGIRLLISSRVSAFYAPCGDYEVSLTLPSDFTVVSTGSESTDGAGALDPPGGTGAGLRHPGLQLL